MFEFDNEMSRSHSMIGEVKIFQLLTVSGGLMNEPAVQLWLSPRRPKMDTEAWGELVPAFQEQPAIYCS